MGLWAAFAFGIVKGEAIPPNIVKYQILSSTDLTNYL